MSDKRKWRTSKKAKKELERRERQRAEHEAKARSESEKRQESIKVRWQELKQAGPNRVGDLAAENDLGAILVDLVGLQKAEIEYMRRFHQLCEWAKSRAPEKLAAVEFAYFRELAECISRAYPAPELTPKQRSELKRHGYNWRDIGRIEYEFGGKGEAESRKQPWAGLSGLPYQATCLDDILRGGFGEIKVLPGFAGGSITIDTRTNMQRLQDLFGMHRNRF